MTGINVRLTTKQLRQLDKLTRHLGLDRSNLIRLAISRLVEDELRRILPTVIDLSDKQK